MKIKTNKNFKKLKKNYLFSEVAKKVKSYSQKHPEADIIKLGIGDVTLPLTLSVTAAMSKAVEEMGKKETFRGYPPEYGYDFLKTAISDYYKIKRINLEFGEIFVSEGAKSDVGNIVDILGKNNILIPDPVYPVYLDSNIMSGNKISFIKANKENNFLPMPTNLAKKAWVIYLCSPNNPSGAVYDKEQLTRWVDFANKTGSVIIFDAAYEAFVSNGAPRSIFEIEKAKTCAVEICSFSKMSGFTGTRCAWTIIPKELENEKTKIKLGDLWARRQATKYNGVSYIIQRGAEAALSAQGLKEGAKNINYYMKNAQLIADCLTKKGIWFTGGVSSPYIWLKCPKDMSSWQFFDFLLEKAQVVGTPGSGFGKEGEGYFRLTSFNSLEATKEAVKRLNKIL